MTIKSSLKKLHGLLTVMYVNDEINYASFVFGDLICLRDLLWQA